MKLRDRGRLDWAEVIALRDAGLTYRAIGERVGCEPTAAYYAVNHVRLRRRRRHAYGSTRPLRHPWTREEAIGAFQRFEREHGHAPRECDLGSEGLPWGATVRRLFGRLSAAQAAAEQEPRAGGRPRKADPWEESTSRLEVAA